MSYLGLIWVNGTISARIKVAWTWNLTSVLRQVRSLFQNEYSKKSDLVLPLLISSALSFPQGHSVAAYVFFLLFSSLPSFRLWWSINNLSFNGSRIRSLWQDATIGVRCVSTVISGELIMDRFFLDILNSDKNFWATKCLGQMNLNRVLVKMFFLAAKHMRFDSNILKIYLTCVFPCIVVIREEETN